MSFIPKLSVLVHGSHINCFPDGTAAQGSVAYIGYNHAVLAIYSLIERGAHSYIGASAHYGIIGINSKRNEESVHGAAQASGKAGFARKHFGQESIEHKRAGHILNAGIFAVALHYF